MSMNRASHVFESMCQRLQIRRRVPRRHGQGSFAVAAEVGVFARVPSNTDTCVAAETYRAPEPRNPRHFFVVIEG
jgi:hypothetical protein